MSKVWQEIVVDWFDCILLCKIFKTHPCPSDEQLIKWLDGQRDIVCHLCGKTYRYK